MIKCYKNFSQILTLNNAYKKDGRNLNPDDLSIIEDGAIVFDDHKILWIGSSSSIPPEYDSLLSKSFFNHVLTPELVDSHTHLVFGGNRSQEYSAKLNGASYEEIASMGGGILSTMRDTLSTDDQTLFNLAVDRINTIYSYGVGTIEIKSGYALTFDGELRISKIIQRLKKHFAPKIQIINTYMAAHAVPNGTSSSDYIANIAIPLMKKLSKDKVIDIVDIFHEQGYFSTADVETLFCEAQKLGLPTKIHADEFNDNDGAKLAMTFNSLSCDHLLKCSLENAKLLGTSSTVATILPGTALFLGKSFPNTSALLNSGAKVAIASDYNPGSCHFDNLLQVASMSAKLLNFNTCQLWSAITLNASAALGLHKQGALVEGLAPRFSIFMVNSFDEIIYSWGKNFNVSPE